MLKNQVGRGIITGILSGLFVHMLMSLNMIPWIAFAGAAICFVLGGTPDAVLKSSLSLSMGSLLGMGMGFSAGLLNPVLGTLAFPVAVGVLCIPLFMYEKVPVMDFIPGHFLGCAIFFASGLNVSALTFYKVFSSTVFGALFGLALAVAIQKYVARFVTPAVTPIPEADKGKVVPIASRKQFKKEEELAS